jgi:hypothetical protein
MYHANAKLNARWETIKEYILNNGIKDYEPPPADDLNTYQVGYNDALNNILNHMKFLEEK